MRKYAMAMMCTLTACGPGNMIDFSVQDDPATLTSSPGDKLFTIAVERTADGWPLVSVEVSVLQGDTGTGQSATRRVPNCKISDKNGDAKLNAGDEISCDEGSTDLFSGADQGNSLTINVQGNSPQYGPVAGERSWKAN